MAKKTKHTIDANLYSYSLKKVFTLSSLSLLQLSSCINKPLQAVDIHRQPIYGRLQVPEQVYYGDNNLYHNHIMPQHLLNNPLQQALIQAVKGGDADKVNYLLKVPSIDINYGGVFISDDNFKKIETRVGILNRKFKKNQSQRNLNRKYTKEEISFPYCQVRETVIDHLGYVTPITTLVLAAKCGHKMVFDALLKANNIDITTFDPHSGESLLNLVIKNKWSSQEKDLVERLNPDDLLKQFYDGKTTLLHLAIQLNMRYDFIELLIDKLPKERLSFQDVQGNTPLHLAIELDLGHLVAYLIDKVLVTDLSLSNHNGKKPLDLAIEKDKLCYVEQLLKRLPTDEVVPHLMHKNKKISDQFSQPLSWLLSALTKREASRSPMADQGYRSRSISSSSFDFLFLPESSDYGIISSNVLPSLPSPEVTLDVPRRKPSRVQRPSVPPPPPPITSSFVPERPARRCVYDGSAGSSSNRMDLSSDLESSPLVSKKKKQRNSFKQLGQRFNLNFFAALPPKLAKLKRSQSLPKMFKGYKISNPIQSTFKFKRAASNRL